MIAYNVLVATVDDVIGNIGTSLKISLPALVAIAVAFSAFFASVAIGLLLGTPTGEVAEDGTMLIDLTDSSVAAMVSVGALAAVLLAAGLSWTAVAWHRFVCLDETPPGLLPRWPKGLVVGYALRVLAIALLLFLLSLALLLVALLGDKGATGEGFLPLFGLPDPMTAKNIVLSIVFGGLFNGLSLRFSTILPAYAVGRPLPLGATAGTFFSVFVPLALLLGAMFMAMDLAATLFPVGGVSGIVMVWLQFMIGIGVLTRIFLHFVPGRAESLP